MIVWIKKEAVGAETDQLAKILYVDGGNLCVRLFDTDEQFDVKAKDISGVEIDDNLFIWVDCHAYKNNLSEVWQF